MSSIDDVVSRSVRVTFDKVVDQETVNCLFADHNIEVSNCTAKGGSNFVVLTREGSSKIALRKLFFTNEYKWKGESYKVRLEQCTEEDLPEELFTQSQDAHYETATAMGSTGTVPKETLSTQNNRDQNQQDPEKQLHRSSTEPELHPRQGIPQRNSQMDPSTPRDSSPRGSMHRSSSMQSPQSHLRGSLPRGPRMPQNYQDGSGQFNPRMPIPRLPGQVNINPEFTQQRMQMPRPPGPRNMNPGSMYPHMQMPGPPGPMGYGPPGYGFNPMPEVQGNPQFINYQPQMPYGNAPRYPPPGPQFHQQGFPHHGNSQAWFQQQHPYGFVDVQPAPLSSEQPSESSSTTEANQAKDENRPKIVEVSGIPQTSTDDTLSLYFESKRNNGGSVEKVELKDKGTALVYFEKSEDADRIAKNGTMTMDGKKIRVSLYLKESESVTEDTEETPCCTIEVRGFRPDMHTDTIETYFENKRRSGGENVENIEKKNDVVYVTFATPEEVENVLKKSHSFEDKTITVKRHVPPKCYKNRFLISNLPKSTTEEILRNYVEARSQWDVTDITFSQEPGKALVTFDEENLPDLDKMRQVFKKKPLKNATLEVSSVPVTDTVIVQGLKPSTSEEAVELYFEGRRSGNKNGHPVTVEFIRDTGICYVTFADCEAVGGVLLVDSHKIEEAVLSVTPYIESLGLTQADSMTTWYQHPDPFTLDTLNMHKCHFLQKTKDKDFKKSLESCHAEFTWLSEDSVTFKCKLSENIPDASKKAKTWRTDTEAAVTKYLEQIEITEIITLTDIWAECCSKLKEIPQKGDALMVSSQTKPKVVIVGKKDSFTELEGKVKEAIESVKGEFERKKAEVTETVKSLKPIQVRLLLAQSFPNETMKTHKHVQAEIKLKQNEVIFKGPVNDVTKCKLDMFERVQTFCSTIDDGFSRAFISFLDKREVKEIVVNRLKGKGLTGAWEPATNGNGLTILSTSEKEAGSVASIIKDSIVEDTQTLEQESVFLLDSDKWNKLEKDIFDKNGQLVNITVRKDDRTITIVATESIFQGIRVKIQEFVAENSIFSRTVKLPKPIHRFLIAHKDNEIRAIEDITRKFNGRVIREKNMATVTIECCKDGLAAAITKLTDLANSVVHRQKSLKQKGIQLLNPEKLKLVIADTERNSSCIVEQEYDETEKLVVEGGALSSHPRSDESHGNAPGHSGHVARCNIGRGREVVVVMTDITTLEVDVIVNAANNRLEHIGGLAKAISVKGGPAIQKESDDYTRKHGKVLAGNAVTTSSGELPCRMVVHAVGPVWSGGSKREMEELQDAVMSSIECADRKGFTSIALPALSSGIFGYPVDLATSHIVEAIKRFYKLESPNSGVSSVYLVDISEKTMGLFVEALTRTFGAQAVDRSSQTPGSSRVPKPATKPKPRLSLDARSKRVFVDEEESFAPTSSLKTTVVTGEIAKQMADVVVNSSGSDLNLSKGVVSKSLLREGGSAIQDELAMNYPRGIKPGEVAVSSGGDLQCKKVYHVALTSWIGGSEDLRQIVEMCLNTASKANMKSIAFPALGTGNLGYPRDVVVKTMYTAVENFKAKNKSLTEVFFVVFPGDRTTVKAFNDYDGSASEVDTADLPSVSRGTVAQRSRAFEQGDMASSSSPSSSTSSSRTDTSQVELVKGEISKTKADVIVNSTASNLDLTKGAVAKSLLTAGGQSIQTELTANYPKGLSVGEIALTSGGKLACKELYHVCMPDWKQQGGTQLLADLVRKCLEKASDTGYTSVAFPALGTGNLGYPRDVVAQTMFSTIEDFQASTKSRMTVTIVVYHKDTTTLGAFEAQKSHRSSGFFGQLKSMIGGIRGPSNTYEKEQSEYAEVQESEEDFTLQSGPVSIEVKQGDITKETADCIVNSTNTDCDLSRGAVSVAIAKLCGQSMTDQCKAKASEMRDNGVISTPGTGGGNFKFVIHVAGDHFGNDWKAVVLACLNEAEKLGTIASIAFPLLGTGAGHLKPEEIATVMTRAFNEFQSQATNIRTIRVVVFDATIMQAVSSVIKSSHGKTGISQKLVAKGDSRRMTSYKDASVELHFFSDDTREIDKGIQLLEKRCANELKTKPVKDPSVAKIIDAKRQSIEQKFGVIIERQNDTMEVTGLAEQSADAVVEITKLLREIEKNEGEVEKAALLSRSVQWCYMEGNNLTDFDEAANAAIEKAFTNKEKKSKVKFGKKTMDIDFGDMKGTSGSMTKKETFNIIRRDLLQEAAASIFDVPKEWAQMKDDEVKAIDLNIDHKEYQEVSQLFMQTLKVPTAKVVGVLRIQNKTLYQQYTAKKKQIEKQNPAGTENERRLWHGTSPDTIESINTHGYNRSYCGKNATAYGQGVYFAVNSSYSAQGTYSRPDANGHQHMYLARVLTGVYTGGNSNMRTPPPKPQGKGPHDLCDSVVNNTQDPVMYIVFNDTQAYPEYLVAFTLQ